MKSTLKTLVRVTGLVVGIGAAAWALRDRILPSPEVHDEPPPAFRTVPSSAAAVSASADDLTEIKGIGPVTATKLQESGITSLAAVAALTPQALADTAGTTTTTATKWIDSAKSLI